MKIEASEFFTQNSYLLRTKVSYKYKDYLFVPLVTGYQEVLDGYDNKISLGDMYMINFTVSGTAKLLYSDRNFTLKANDLTIVHTYVSRQLIKTGDEPWIIYFSHFNTIAATQLLRHIMTTGGIVIHNFPKEIIESCMLKTHELMKLKPTRENRFKISLLNYEMLLKIINYIEENDINVEFMDIVEGAKLYMKNNMQDIKSIKDLMFRIDCSQTHFERLFKEREGITPNEYLNNLKLLRSKDLLKTTNLYIKEIADKCGFKDVRSFMYYFKEKYKMTPSKYRELNI